MAQSISFENSAGDGSQAVALMSMSNQSVFYKCAFLGYQDTLYARDGYQFYKECDIYGTVDFIFGDATAVFQSCNIYARLPNRVVTFTAQGRKDPHKKSGFVMQNCSFTAAPGLESDKSSIQGYLGRPWFSYSSVVIMESYLGSIIDPAGWLEWPGTPTNRLTYREYKNWGPGAETSKRVSWTGFQVLHQSDEVISFTVDYFIDGYLWLPATMVPYTNGLMMEE